MANHTILNQCGMLAGAATYTERANPIGRAPGMTGIDWAVLVVYAAGMLLIGWYFSRRTTSAEDYLLGGRKMNPLGLGLSLFATMLSAVTYLALPGEVIQHGPIFILGKIAAYPFVAIVVGWLLIPYIMQLRVSSAYEILEKRLGLSVRMLGSVFFLALRLMWMSVVVFAASDKVLVPLLGLSGHAWATPTLCAVLGTITVIYTSMGGLRAVVLSDIIQSYILFGGVILALIIVTVHFGGFGWWPRSWPEHWAEPHWIWPPGQRTTFLGALIATFTWFVCTNGSDQMAIQRYLAGRDIATARRTLIASLTASALAGALLSVVGLALMAYFFHLSTAPAAVLAEPDRLFPRFIARDLPVGVSGLVIAGLLAAAMSSLSSGVNASCSVITVDFIDRFRHGTPGEREQVRMAQLTSAGTGVVVVLLSSVIGMVEGNLLALGFKICNLLTAPLFGLFFMALFVRWATVPGTLLGAAAGVATVVVVSFWKDVTGHEGISFLWAMPLGLIVQIAAGSLASFIPLGPRKTHKEDILPPEDGW